ncbi:hypothetical protein C8J56DRAFT_1082220 [Mycena floridula]|nr:hypothetical protein C8J56DRAFT_1082220 [Mycena floridula]
MGDIASLKAVFRRCEHDGQLFRQFLPILFLHISQPPGPPETAILPDLVFDSLTAFALRLHHGPFADSSAATMPTVMDNWVPLHQWLLFIFEELIEPCPDLLRSSEYHKELCSVVTFILDWVSTNNKADEVERPPGYIAIVFTALDRNLAPTNGGLDHALRDSGMIENSEFIHSMAAIPSAVDTIILTLKKKGWISKGAGAGLAAFANDVASLIITKSRDPPPYNIARACASAWGVVLRALGSIGVVDIIKSSGLEAMSDLAPESELILHGSTSMIMSLNSSIDGSSTNSSIGQFAAIPSVLQKETLQMLQSVRYCQANASSIDRDWIICYLLEELKVLWSQRRYELAPSDRERYPILVSLNRISPNNHQILIQTAKQYLVGKTQDQNISKLLEPRQDLDDLLFHAVIPDSIPGHNFRS